MHIAYCCSGWPPDGAANGVVSYVRAMRDALGAEGHRVSIIANSVLYTADGDQHALTGRPDLRGRLDQMVLRLERRLDGRRGHLPGVARWIAEQVRQAHRIAPIDIVEMEESFGWPERVERLARVPVAVRLHGPHFLKPDLAVDGPEGRRNAQRLDAEGRAIRHARAISAPTEAVLDATRHRYGIAQDRSAIIPNPVPPVPDHLRWQPGACDPDQLLFVGRFDFWKGADTVIAAFAALAPRRPGLRLTIVGPDLGIPDRAGTMLDFHGYLAQHVPPQVRGRILFTGRLPPERIAELRQRAAMCLIASRAENFPYALFEAFAAGCPVVSTKWLGAAALIADEMTGLLATLDDTSAYADRIAWVLDHPDLAARMGAAARADCEMQYAPRRISRAVADFYGSRIGLGAA